MMIWTSSRCECWRYTNYPPIFYSNNPLREMWTLEIIRQELEEVKFVSFVEWRLRMIRITDWSNIPLEGQQSLLILFSPKIEK
jgi:hypothetical protein